MARRREGEQEVTDDVKCSIEAFVSPLLRVLRKEVRPGGAVDLGGIP